MYKVASSKQQNSARRLSLADLQSGLIAKLSPEEQRDAIKGRCASLEAQLREVKHRHRAREIGIELQELQSQLRALKPQKEPTPKDLPHFFVESAKEMLPAGMYKIVMNEARKRAEEHRHEGN